MVCGSLAIEALRIPKGLFSAPYVFLSVPSVLEAAYHRGPQRVDNHFGASVF
jgi:hypothetical protein